jgi:hypothetical protein
MRMTAYELLTNAERITPTSVRVLRCFSSGSVGFSPGEITNLPLDQALELKRREFVEILGHAK